MPIPFLIPIGIAIATAALGGVKQIKAVIDNKDAKDLNKSANEIITEAKKELEEARQASNTALEALGSKKLYVLDNSIPRFIASFEKLKNVHLEDSAGLDELNKFRFDKQSAFELRKLKDYISSLLGGAAGALGGALAAFGAYGAAMTFGATAGGTAIATLHGIAAYNATMAFLGGGALAAGGAGMAGGMMVLGGLVAGPALAIMGFIVGAKAAANLDNAKSNLAEAQKIAEELKTMCVLCHGIQRRSYMFERLLIRLDALFFPLIFGMETIISQKGDDWHGFSDEEKKTIAAAASIAKAIKTVLDTPILTDEGKITEESAQVTGEIKPVVDAYKKAS